MTGPREYWWVTRFGGDPEPVEITQVDGHEARVTFLGEFWAPPMPEALDPEGEYRMVLVKRIEF